jgi:putative membrane-bound dehydrogenase-like protein
MMKSLLPLVLAALWSLGALPAASLNIKHDEAKGTLTVYRGDSKDPLLTQNARPDFRPYLHPIVAPDGKGILTEYSPGHHKHQTGLYWGFTRVNGRDYFHHPEGDYWKRISAKVLKGSGDTVSWETVYHLLGKNGEAVLQETQQWTLLDKGDQYALDLVWKGKALKPVTIGKYDYGGLFLRMPWKKGLAGGVVNGRGQRGSKAEGQRANWIDVGMEIEGRKDQGRISIFDHRANEGFPQAWRVDGQLGVGPVRARTGDWQIAKGKEEVIKHRIVVSTGDLAAEALTKQWREYSEQSLDHRLWGKAQQEGRAAKFLSPKEAVDQMTVRDGYQVNVFASEPMITQPMAFCWDDRGRMWIAENRDYESRGHGFSKFGDSRILILEDTDRDGVADTKKVFLEGIPFPAGIAVGFDGVWLGAPPNLLFVPDRDGDDRADMDDIEVRLTGWGIRDRHETLNSFHWGPDGWLYGCQGFATPSLVGKPKGDGKLSKKNEPFPKDIPLEGAGTPINGGVWRYHPTKDLFEVVAHGFSNPWGIDFDAKGQCFITACVIPHMWHVIPGGIYHRQGGRHYNPYIYRDIRTIVDHAHQSAHGGARVYLSDAFPPDQHGRLFMANIHEHAVLTDVLTRKGSGFVASHGEDFLRANNAQWIGFSMEIGPGGNVYVLDWHDADICGKEVLNKETGRVFRIAPEKSLAVNWKNRYADLNTLPDSELVDLQTSASAWHARRARGILQKRAHQGKLSQGAHGQLRDLLEKNPNSDWKLRALWTLHVTGGLTEESLFKLLDHKDEYLRAWAVQLLTEDQQASSETVAKFVTMASEDDSPTVRLYLAAAMQRLPIAQRWELVEALTLRGEDKDDHNIPKMIWFGLEPMVSLDPARALKIAHRSGLPILTQWVARRAAEGDQKMLGAAMISLGSPEGSKATQRDLLQGIRDGLGTRQNLKATPEWLVQLHRFNRDDEDPKIKGLALELSQLFGNVDAEKAMLTTVSNENASLPGRKTALAQLADQKNPSLQKLIPDLLNDDKLRTDTIRALASYEDENLTSHLLKRYPKLSESDKLEALRTLASRPKSGWALTQAIQNKSIPKKEVPAYVARQLRRVVGNGFVEIWGPIDLLPADKQKALKKYEKLLSEATLTAADQVKGKVVFSKTCSACHKLNGEGGMIGPDLTGSNRADLNYLLDNILNPSAVIQDDYKLKIITTRDGRTLTGNIARENDRQLTLRMVGQDTVIDKSTIQSRETVPVSMMPEGLLETLTEKEVIDLVAYLRTMENVKK